MANKILKDEETGERYRQLTSLEAAQEGWAHDDAVFLKRIPPPKPMPELQPGDVVIGKSPHTHEVYVVTLTHKALIDPNKWRCVNLTDGLRYSTFLEEWPSQTTKDLTHIYRDGQLLWKKAA